MTQSFEEFLLIGAPPGVVWEHLTSPRRAPEWMGDPQMAVTLETDWTVGRPVGRPVVVRGFHHVPFRNTGTVLAFEPGRRLAYTHLSSLSHLPDEPASHATLAFTLAQADGGTLVHLVATGFPTEAVYRHLGFYWGGALACLKQQVERPHRSIDLPAGSGIDGRHP